MLLFLSEFVRATVLVSLLPDLVTVSFGLPLSIAAFAISAHYLMDTFGRSPSGWLVDRFGARAVTGVGTAISLLALFMVSRATVTSPLWLILAVYGIGTSPLWPSVITTATRGREEKRGSVIGGIFAIWIVAIGVGPVLMNFLLPAHLQTGLMIILAVQAVAFLLALLLPARAAHLGVPLPSLAVWRQVGKVSVLFPGMFAQTMTIGILLPELNLFLHNVLGLIGFRYGEMLAVGGGLAVLLMVPLGRMADRAGVRRPLVIGFGLAAVGLVFFGQARQFWPAALLAAMIGVAFALILPAWNTLLASTVHPRAEASLWGVFMTVEGLGLTVGPVLGAAAWGLMKPEGPFLLAAVILAVMCLFYALYPLDRLKMVDET
ncbi:MAG: MFS transporter [Sulfobacillus sp.]